MTGLNLKWALTYLVNVNGLVFRTAISCRAQHDINADGGEREDDQASIGLL
jgi:hypothetical protein